MIIFSPLEQFQILPLVNFFFFFYPTIGGGQKGGGGGGAARLLRQRRALVVFLSRLWREKLEQGDDLE